MASSPRRVAMMSCSGAVEFLPSCTGSSTTPRRRSPLPDLRDIMSHTLVVLPDDTAEPFVAAIAAARKSLRIKMFLFSDPTLLAAVIATRKRGVHVRVMLNPARRSGEEVKDSNPAFDLTHEKSMVIDDEIGFVKSLNWETRNLTETRDYAVITRT